jgi:hypothetical protein
MLLKMQLGSMEIPCRNNTHIFLKIFENLDVVCKQRCTDDSS